MLRDRAFSAFLAIFLADFTVRTAYMAGKSPLLPVFAHELGANAVFLGAIVAISTLTGLVSKPLFGLLSDYHGQWVWLLIGTILFAATPLLYLWVETTPQLVALRLVHGLATAIYGPVTLAFVAGLGSGPRAELFGWFSLSRTVGYIVGPLVGGALLHVLNPAQVYACTSLVATLAFLPVLSLRHSSKRTKLKKCADFALAPLLRALLQNRPLLTFGCVEMISRVGVYAVKTFLPLMIIADGGSPLEAGVFLSIQEAAVAVTRPIAGRLADLWQAPGRVAVSGLVLMAGALLAVPWSVEAGVLTYVAVLLGVGNGAYHPAALFMIARSAGDKATGTAFGVVGAMRNLGKLMGPIVGGALIYSLPADQAFLCLALITLLAAGPLAMRRPIHQRKALDLEGA